MTRKDFLLIAELIEALGPTCYRARVAEAFALRLRSTNPRFDAARFLVACGVDSTYAAAKAQEIERTKPVFS